jgi:hypothetical protein
MLVKRLGWASTSDVRRQLFFPCIPNLSFRQRCSFAIIRDVLLSACTVNVEDMQVISMLMYLVSEHFSCPGVGSIEYGVLSRHCYSITTSWT